MMELVLRALRAPGWEGSEPASRPRREFLGGAMPAAGAALAAPALLGAASPALAAGPKRGSLAPQPGEPIDSGFVSFPDERAEFRTHFRIERDLRDQGEVVTWYHFTQFAAAEGVRPVPVVRYEGMEYSYFRRIGDLTWRIHAHNLSFPRDLRTGAFVDRVRNPITGEEIAPVVMALTEDPGVLYSPAGYLPLDSKSGKPLKPYSMYHTEGELAVVTHVRAAPDTWPTDFIETSISWFDRALLHDERVTSIPYHTSGFYQFPFPRWMQMGDRRGHMIGSWRGRKLGSVAELPREFRARAERDYPQLLKARWGELERPMSPVVAATVKA